MHNLVVMFKVRWRVGAEAELHKAGTAEFLWGHDLIECVRAALHDLELDMAAMTVCWRRKTG